MVTEKGFKKIAASANGTIIMMPILLRRDIPEAVPMEHNVDDQVMTQSDWAVFLARK